MLEGDFKNKLNLCLQLKNKANTLLKGEFFFTVDFQRLALAFALKSHKTFKAIIYLVKKGLPEPALVLVRSLFEDVVNLAYIAQDPHKLSSLFLNFSVIEKKFYLDNLKEAGLLDKETERIWQKEFATEYQNIEADYPNKRYWSGKNIKQMAEATGPELTRTYYLLYVYSSGFAHGSSSLTLEDYLQPTKIHSLKPLNKAQPNQLTTVLELAYNLFSHCLKIFTSAQETSF